MIWTILLVLTAIAAILASVIRAGRNETIDRDRPYRNRVDDLVARINNKNIFDLVNDQPGRRVYRTTYSTAGRVVDVTEINNIQNWKDKKIEAEAEAWVQSLIENSGTPVY